MKTRHRQNSHPVYGHCVYAYRYTCIRVHFVYIIAVVSGVYKAQIAFRARNRRRPSSGRPRRPFLFYYFYTCAVCARARLVTIILAGVSQRSETNAYINCKKTVFFFFVVFFFNKKFYKVV